MQTIARTDFKTVLPEIERLLQYATVFNDFDRDWSRLANGDDGFDIIYELGSPRKESWEEIYSIGREFAGSMVFMLQEVDDVGRHPTLTSYVKRFSNTWVTTTDSLEERLVEARSLFENSDVRPWAIRQMMGLYEKQVGLLKAVRTILEILKRSDLYKMENGLPIENGHKGQVTIGHFQGVMGNVSHSHVVQDFSKGIRKGDLESLLESLKPLGIAEDDLNNLSAIVREEQPNPGQTAGPRLSSWIGGMVAKSASGAWKFSVDVASQVLAAAITRYYQG